MADTWCREKLLFFRAELLRIPAQVQGLMHVEPSTDLIVAAHPPLKQVAVVLLLDRPGSAVRWCTLTQRQLFLCIPSHYLFLTSFDFVTSNQIRCEFIARPWSGRFNALHSAVTVHCVPRGFIITGGAQMRVYLWLGVAERL